MHHGARLHIANRGQCRSSYRCPLLPARPLICTKAWGGIDLHTSEVSLKYFSNTPNLAVCPCRPLALCALNVQLLSLRERGIKLSIIMLFRYKRYFLLLWCNESTTWFQTVPQKQINTINFESNTLFGKKQTTKTKGFLNASYMQPVGLLARGLWRFVVRPEAAVVLSGEPVEELMPAVKIPPRPSSMFTFRAFNLSAPQWNVRRPSTMTLTVAYWSAMLKWSMSRVRAEFPSHSLALYYHVWGQNKWCPFSL